MLCPMVVLSAEHRRGAADYFDGTAELVAGPSVGAAPPDRKLFLDASKASAAAAARRVRRFFAPIDRHICPRKGAQ
jgi:hypothetical protein